jgi:hypothetical protein
MGVCGCGRVLVMHLCAEQQDRKLTLHLVFGFDKNTTSSDGVQVSNDKNFEIDSRRVCPVFDLLAIARHPSGRLIILLNVVLLCNQG